MNGTNGKNEIKIRLHKGIHFVLTVLLFSVAWHLFRYGKLFPAKHIGQRYDVYAILLYIILLSFFNRTYNTYVYGYFRMRELVLSQCMANFFAAAAVYLIACLAWWHFRSPLLFLGMLVLQGILNILMTWGTNLVYFRVYDTAQCIVIYRNDNDLRRLGQLKGKPMERRFQIARYLRYEGNDYFEIINEIKKYDAVFVAGIDATLRNGIAKYCADYDVPLFVLPLLGDIIVQSGTHIQSFSTPVLSVTRKHPNPEYLIAKRVFDIVSSACAFLILSPLLLVVGLMIHFYDGGPALYRQARLTKDGKEFTLYKFRSMRTDAESDGKARLSTGKNDDRITPIGRFMRACRLDELPQLINILKGDMSVVGPRPERPGIQAKYEETLPEFRLRLQVKAGLTGYAQVYGRYNSEPYEKLGFDLLYMNNMSILTDLQLIFATVRILFSKESTEGFETMEVQDAKAKSFDK